jgi:hypothetical protein
MAGFLCPLKVLTPVKEATNLYFHRHAGRGLSLPMESLVDSQGTKRYLSGSVVIWPAGLQPR